MSRAWSALWLISTASTQNKLFSTSFKGASFVSLKLLQLGCKLRRHNAGMLACVLLLQLTIRRTGRTSNLKFAGIVL